MGKCRLLIASGLIAVCAIIARAADIGISDRADEFDASTLRNSRAAALSGLGNGDLAERAPGPSDATSAGEQQLAPLVRQPEEVLASPVYQPSSAEIAPGLPVIPRLVETTWYTRFDYMDWSSRGRAFDQGALYTLGYQRRVGRERFRAELFGTEIPGTLIVNSATNRYPNHIDYLGGRAEYDHLFETAWAPRFQFFGGVGSRFWLRDQTQVQIPYFLSPDFQQTWLTFYPYVGMETRRDETRAVEFYGRARVGLLALTYEHMNLPDRAFYRDPGVTGQVESGIRGDRLFLAGFFEAFAWPSQQGSPSQLATLLTPRLLLTIGLKAGFNY
jgi:hypothetical protein